MAVAGVHQNERATLCEYQQHHASDFSPRHLLRKFTRSVAALSPALWQLLESIKTSGPHFASTSSTMLATFHQDIYSANSLGASQRCRLHYGSCWSPSKRAGHTLRVPA